MHDDDCTNLFGDLAPTTGGDGSELPPGDVSPRDPAAIAAPFGVDLSYLPGLTDLPPGGMELPDMSGDFSGAESIPPSLSGLDMLYLPPPPLPEFDIFDENGNLIEDTFDLGFSSEDGAPRLHPIGFDENGIPVYRTMPDAFQLSKIDGPFIAPVQHVGPGFSTHEYIEFPEAGAERDARLEEVNRQFCAEYDIVKSLQSRETMELELQHMQNQGRLAELEWEHRTQDLRYQSEDMQLARIEGLTVDQYRTVHDMRLEPVGPKSADLFQNPDTGEMWKVDGQGHARRTDENGHLL